MRGRVRARVVDLGWAAGWALVGWLPERVVRAATSAVADLLWRRSGKPIRQLERNLARVRPEATPEQLRVLTRKGMRSYARYWGEVFRLHRWSSDHVLSRVVLHEPEAFWEAVHAGRGVVVALPHQANWDLAAAWARANGLRLTTVVERLRPERLFDRFVAYREALGMEILPLTGGRDPFPTLAERLRSGGLVCLVADRDLSERGVQVDFLGSPARMPAGPAALRLRTGATLIPITMWYDGDAMHLRFHDPVEPDGRHDGIRALTQQVADAFAEGIVNHPADWHMLQRLWLDDAKLHGE